MRIDPDPSIPGAWLIAVKAVPGARRDEIAGVLGDRLKVRVSAAPENGKANQAICGLIAEALGLRASAIEVVRGHTSAEKTLRCAGTDRAAIDRLASE